MTSRSSTATGAARPAVHVIALTGDLDENGASRLLRSCDARLHLLDVGHAALTDIVVDMATARRTSTAAIAVLEHARDGADRRAVGFHLVGVGPAMAAATPRDRHRLGRFPSFPDVATAMAALDPHHDPARRPVDPDALPVTGP